MFNIPENPDTECLAKAIKRGQRTFTVVEQDQTAVKTIAYWIFLNIETCPAAKLRKALDDCIAMREFAGKKAAD